MQITSSKIYATLRAVMPDLPAERHAVWAERKDDGSLEVQVSLHDSDQVVVAMLNPSLYQEFIDRIEAAISAREF